MSSISGEFVVPEVQNRVVPQITPLGMLNEAAQGNLGVEISDERQRLLFEAIPHFLVDADIDDGWVCMDGRPCAGLLNGEKAKPRFKVGGGNLLTTYVGMELMDENHLLETIRSEHATPLSVQEEMQSLQDDIIIDAFHGRTAAHTCVPEHLGPIPGDSGCGAGAKLIESMALLAREGRSSNKTDHVATITAEVSRVPFDVEYHREIVIPKSVKFIKRLVEDSWKGTDLLEIVKHPTIDGKVAKAMGAESVEVLDEEHAEELFAFHKGRKTLDRDEFVRTIGARMFWVDEGALWRLAKKYGSSQDETRHMYQTFLTYQTAIGLTLGGPMLRAAIVG